MMEKGVKRNELIEFFWGFIAQVLIQKMSLEPQLLEEPFVFASLVPATDI